MLPEIAADDGGDLLTPVQDAVAALDCGARRAADAILTGVGAPARPGIGERGDATPGAASIVGSYGVPG